MFEPDYEDYYISFRYMGKDDVEADINAVEVDDLIRSDSEAKMLLQTKLNQSEHLTRLILRRFKNVHSG